MMKILYDFQIFQMQQYGGVSRYFHELIRSIGKLNDVNIMIFFGLHQSGFDWKSQRSICTKQFAIQVPPWIAARKLTTAINYAGFTLFQSFGPSPDIIHLTYYPYKIFRKRKSKLVITLYDMIQELHPEYYADDASIMRKKRALFEADLILCISEATRKDLLHYYSIDPTKVCTVHLGPTFLPALIQDEKSVHIPHRKKRPYFLFVGIRGTYKNFQNAIRAYAGDQRLVKDFDFLCFGSTPFSVEEQNMFNNYGIGKQTFHRSGTDQELWSSYRHAHLFIYPSLYEGFGFPLLEAMAVGCPIVASNRGSIPEVLGEAGVLFNPSDDSSIIDAMTKVAYDDILRKSLVEKGYSRLNYFSWEKTAKETYNAYLDMLGGKL